RLPKAAGLGVTERIGVAVADVSFQKNSSLRRKPPRYVEVPPWLECAASAWAFGLRPRSVFCIAVGTEMSSRSTHWTPTSPCGSVKGDWGAGEPGQELPCAGCTTDLCRMGLYVLSAAAACSIAFFV